MNRVTAVILDMIKLIKNPNDEGEGLDELNEEKDEPEEQPLKHRNPV